MANGTPGWISPAFIVMAVVQFMLVGVGAWGMLETRQLADNNRNAAELDEARDCVEAHKTTTDTREAVNITPDVIAEITAGDPETDVEQLQRFLDGIRSRVEDKLPFPNCDLLAAERRVAQG